MIKNLSKKSIKKIGFRVLFLITLVFVMVFIVNVNRVYSQQNTDLNTSQQGEINSSNAEVMKFALVSAAIAFGLAAVGAGIAIASVGAAAMGAISEKPEMVGSALIFVALAEGLVVFGVIVAFIILGKV